MNLSLRLNDSDKQEQEGILKLIAAIHGLLPLLNSNDIYKCAFPYSLVI